MTTAHSPAEEWKRRYRITSVRGNIWSRANVRAEAIAIGKRLVLPVDPAMVDRVLDDETFMKARGGEIPARVCEEVQQEAWRRALEIARQQAAADAAQARDREEIAAARDRLINELCAAPPFKGWRGFSLSLRQCALMPAPSASTGYIGPEHFAALAALGAELPHAVHRDRPQVGIYLVFGLPKQSV